MVKSDGLMGQNPKLQLISHFFVVEKKGRYAREMTALYFHLPKNVNLVGGSAYGDQLNKVIPTKDEHKPATTELSVTIKSLQESTFKRFKDF